MKNFIPKINRTLATKKTKLFTFFLALVTSMGMMFAENGTCGKNLTWDLTDGILTINGTGAMDDYDWDNNPWELYKSLIVEVSIGNNVTSIGNYAFHNCYDLKSIEIPNSVTSIGEWAFAGCTNLSSVILGNGVTSVGLRAFYNCNSLSSAIHNDNIFICLPVSYSGAYVIPDGIQFIANNAFSDCSELTSVSIPNSVTRIGILAFSGCTNLTSLTIPASVLQTPNLAYLSVEAGNPVYDSRNNCNAIIETATNTLISGCKNTIIPNTITNISASAFYRCSTLTSIHIPTSVTRIGSAAFYDTGLTSVEIPSNTSIIGPSGYQAFGGAFAECHELTSVVFAEGDGGPISIGSDAFCNCNKLNNVVLSSNITTICNQVFEGCNLTSIEIPESVASIGCYAFSNCSSLTKITCKAITPPILDPQEHNGPQHVFVNVDKSIPLYVPAGSVEAYKSADGWKDFTNIQAISSVDKHTISITATNGHVEGAGEYDTGTSVTLTAVPDEGYVFDHWADGNTDNPRTIVLTQDTAFTAEFAIYVNEEESHVENNPSIASAEQDFDIVGTSYTIPGLFNAGHGGIQSGDMPDKGVKFRISRASTVDALKENAIDFKVNFGYVINSITLIGVTNTADVAASISEVFVDGIKYSGMFDNTLPAKGGGASSNVVIAGINAKSSIIFTFNRGTVTQANICYEISYSINTNPVVRFLDWNGNMLSEQIVETNQSAIAPSVPLREGYTFIGWDKDFSNITEDLVVTAQYKINRFYVQFLDWDNTILKADSVDWNTAAIAPANPSREGYDFLGWDKEFGSVTSDLVINAQYEYGRTTNYSMTFVNGQNSEEIFDEIVTIKVPAAPTIAGFTFLKWEIVSGDLADGFIIQAVYTPNTPTDAPAVFTNPANSAQKLIRQGNVYILTGDKTYTITGQAVK